MSVVLVNWLSDMKGVLGMAPVMIRSANACTLRNFVAFMLVNDTCTVHKTQEVMHFDWFFLYCNKH